MEICDSERCGEWEVSSLEYGLGGGDGRVELGCVGVEGGVDWWGDRVSVGVVWLWTAGGACGCGSLAGWACGLEREE